MDLEHRPEPYLLQHVAQSPELFGVALLRCFWLRFRGRLYRRLLPHTTTPPPMLANVRALAQLQD
jgi:hypothetical protein